MTEVGSSEGVSRETLDAAWRRGFDWLETELGLRILSFEKQARWRPAYFVEAEREGEALSLYLRGERGALDHGVYPLEHESRVLQVLEAEGLPVPHVHGFCPDPKFIVMDRMPGRANLATAKSDEERTAVLGHYMDLLADLHTIDPKRFEELGIDRPKGAEALALCDLARWEQSYRTSKKRPEPLIEFVTAWVHRNVPREREEVACLAVDSGQFLFDQGRVTSLLDLELACLGDPAADLAGMRGRDMGEPLGPLEPAFERYYAKTGKRIPKHVLDYHTVRFNLYTPYTCAPLVAEPPESIDLVVYLGWHWLWSRACIEVIADGAGVDLPTPSIPDPVPTSYSGGHAFLANKLGTLHTAADRAHAYELDIAARTASYLERVETLWPAMQADEAAEIDAFLGRVTTPLAREADFEAFVLEHGEAREPELLQFFQKRCLRQEALLGSAMGPLAGSTTQLF